MKSFYLFVVISITLFSCSNSSQCKDLESAYPPEIFTLYQHKGKDYNAIKVFKISENQIQVNHISITPAEDLAPLQQTLVKKELFSIEEKDRIKEKYKKAYSLQLKHTNDVFWIQIQPTKEMLGDKKDFEYRDMIEDLINKELMNNNAGIFFAGHVGHTGLNMLCHYYKERVAIESIFKILCENGLEDHTLIAKRVHVADADWIHEVVYPLGFTGEFQSL
ncbi:hypothetical protein [uncultured Kordia sp.]|uniref:hypothetical protein n=1 Tax=uncultured Kordia sp. TaxID=507699 RepID=UPI0026103575|nr:hypothetical protein [uncultured Kordia sp.]